MSTTSGACMLTTLSYSIVLSGARRIFCISKHASLAFVLIACSLNARCCTLMRYQKRVERLKNANLPVYTVWTRKLMLKNEHLPWILIIMYYTVTMACTCTAKLTDVLVWVKQCHGLVQSAWSYLYCLPSADSADPSSLVEGLTHEISGIVLYTSLCSCDHA